MKHRFEVLFFDLGNTLIYSGQPWPKILAASYEALMDALQNSGCNLDRKVFLKKFLAQLDAYHLQREKDFLELTTLTLLENLLKEMDHTLPLEQVRHTLDRRYAVTRTNWLLEDDTLPTLQALQALGYPLGLISNASSAEDARTLLANHNLTEFFDPILISAEVGLRKPHPHIFELALQSTGTLPQNALMVGDTLQADVLGARKAGLASVWITRRANPALYSKSIKPDYSIRTLSELPDLLG